MSRKVVRDEDFMKQDCVEWIINKKNYRKHDMPCMIGLHKNADKMFYWNIRKYHKLLPSGILSYNRKQVITWNNEEKETPFQYYEDNRISNIPYDKNEFHLAILDKKGASAFKENGRYLFRLIEEEMRYNCQKLYVHLEGEYYQRNH